MNWYIKVLKNYLTFSGRASRPEFWWFTLIHTLIVFFLLIVDFTMGNVFVMMSGGEFVRLTGSLSEMMKSGDVVQIIGVTMMLYLLLVMLPQLAVTIRRLHDSGKSGWWVLLGIVPLGIIVLMVLLALPSEPKDNRFGASLGNTKNSNEKQDSMLM